MKSLSEYVRECRGNDCREKKNELRAHRKEIKRHSSRHSVKESKVCKRSRRLIKEGNSWWCGVPGVEHIWHGEWSDPEICYKGFLLNELDVQEYISDTNNLNDLSQDEFTDWLCSNPEEIIDCLDSMLASGCGKSLEESRRQCRKPIRESRRPKQKYRMIKECVKPFKRTFPDDKTQNRFNNDFKEMLAGLPDEKFMSKYFERRLRFDDPDSVDAIWQEYVKRFGKK